MVNNVCFQQVALTPELREEDNPKKILAVEIDAPCDIVEPDPEKPERNTAKQQMQYIDVKFNSVDRHPPSLDQKALEFYRPPEVHQWRSFVYATCTYSEPSEIRKWGWLKNESRELVNLHIGFRLGNLKKKHLSMNRKIEQQLTFVQKLSPGSRERFEIKC